MLQNMFGLIFHVLTFTAGDYDDAPRVFTCINQTELRCRFYQMALVALREAKSERLWFKAKLKARSRTITGNR